MQNRWSEKILVRNFRRADLEGVARLEAGELSGWPSGLVEEELDQLHGISLVAVVGGQLVGWCCARHVGDEAELLKICVKQRFRRSKYGTELITALQSRLLEYGIDSLFLEVRAGNEAAVLFYTRLGFTPAGRRINYYNRPSDDALVLKKQISSTL